MISSEYVLSTMPASPVHARGGELPEETCLTVSCQVSDLWCMLIARDLQAAQALLRVDRLSDAARALRRAVHYFEPLRATWRSIRWMTPKDLGDMRLAAFAADAERTGFQGDGYRHMLRLLGVSRGEGANSIVGPDVYDDVLAHFGRIGLFVPEQALTRAPSAPRIPCPEVEQIWREIHEDPYPDASLRQLADVLADIAAEFIDWKHCHLIATPRTFGDGAAALLDKGIDSATAAADAIPFPELWSARGFARCS
ncbi:MAG: tryptophan 2,3-dioxygenase [Variovorax sp.]|nr:tryptophan 2,3-dioxygenase [Variovorax sp.]